MEIEREVYYRVAWCGRELGRHENGGWEERYGDSWETVYDDAELEAEFQASQNSGS